MRFTSNFVAVVQDVVEWCLCYKFIKLDDTQHGLYLEGPSNRPPVGTTNFGAETENTGEG